MYKVTRQDLHDGWFLHEVCAPRLSSSQQKRKKSHAAAGDRWEIPITKISNLLDLHAYIRVCGKVLLTHSQISVWDWGDGSFLCIKDKVQLNGVNRHVSHSLLLRKSQKSDIICMNVFNRAEYRIYHDNTGWKIPNWDASDSSRHSFTAVCTCLYFLSRYWEVESYPLKPNQPNGFTLLTDAN